MQVFLVGGGWSDERVHEMFGGFLRAAAARAPGRDPRVVMVLMGTDEEAVEYHERYVRALGLVASSLPHDLVVERVAEGATFDASVLEEADGLLVGGGDTPEYHRALSPTYDVIRGLVTDGLPYAGFSAGSAIAARTAIIGGWLLDGVPVCPEDSSEDLEELTVVEGIGLVDGAIDVHAAQWGTLSRLVAAVRAGLVPHGVAIDECTTLGPGGVAVGVGRAWRVGPAPDGVVVSRG